MRDVYHLFRLLHVFATPVTARLFTCSAVRCVHLRLQFQSMQVARLSVPVAARLRLQLRSQRAFACNSGHSVPLHLQRRLLRAPPPATPVAACLSTCSAGRCAYHRLQRRALRAPPPAVPIAAGSTSICSGCCAPPPATLAALRASACNSGRCADLRGKSGYSSRLRLSVRLLHTSSPVASVAVRAFTAIAVGGTPTRSGCCASLQLRSLCLRFLWRYTILLLRRLPRSTVFRLLSAFQHPAPGYVGSRGVLTSSSTATFLGRFILLVSIHVFTICCVFVLSFQLPMFSLPALLAHVTLASSCYDLTFKTDQNVLQTAALWN
ncbi:hypothetical protein RR48_11990 [Papilio machaon]|uniref:Uncharacterized protein n=1 Tax=Papilio machaon TaxID=76193 RepID=A0A194RKS6_PAPMA|nr:hypothetical protein RR48_11990 [Papilio machaon]